MSSNLLGPAIVAVAFVFMAWWSWGTWPDILVDFGRELYIPWRLMSGECLYTDIAYYSGPLSPYLNALWFKLFGVGLETLVRVNLVIAAGLTILLYRAIRLLSDQFTATVCSLVFVLLFAFAQYVGIGNYNYICPYSHDAVHGLILSLLGLMLAYRFLEHGRTTALAGCGLMLGLSFLTRAEVFLPGAIAALVTLALGFRLVPQTRSMRRLAILPACCLIPPSIAMVLLSTHMPFKAAFTATLGTWPQTIKGTVASMGFFRIVLGTDDVPASIRTMLLWTAVYGAILLLLMAIARLIGRSKGGGITLHASLFLATMIPPALLWWRNPPIDELRPLPLFMLAIITGEVIALTKRNGSPTVHIRRLGLALFALVSLGKVILNVKIIHYGFIPSMPALLLTVATMLCWIPGWFDRRHGGGAQIRSACLGLIAGFAIVHLRLESIAFASKTDDLVVHRGVDSFRGDERANPVRAALNSIDELIRPGETLVALPEGVMLNYLTRHVNPTAHTNWMPTEFIIFGEESMFRSLRDHPPDWIVLVHKDTSEFGVRFFGLDYGQTIMAWVRANYREVRTILDRPLESELFGIQFLRRR